MKKTAAAFLALLLLTFSACKKKDNDPSPQNNQAPVVENEAYTIDANSSNNSLTIMLNDTDPEGDSLILSGYSSPKGTLTAMFSTASGKSWLVYTPEVNHIGTVILSYTLSDGKGNSTSGSVTLTVGNEAQTLTWKHLQPFFNWSILQDNDANKTLTFYTTTNMIASSGLGISALGNGENWSIKSDGKLHVSNGSTVGNDFTVSSFINSPVPGRPYSVRGLKLMLDGTTYTFYETIIE